MPDAGWALFASELVTSNLVATLDSAAGIHESTVCYGFAYCCTNVFASDNEVWHGVTLG